MGTIEVSKGEGGRRMQEPDVIGRIKQLCQTRGWSYYRLAKESGITYSTLNTLLRKAYCPAVPTLCRICDGFGITLEQFFFRRGRPRWHHGGAAGASGPLGAVERPGPGEGGGLYPGAAGQGTAVRKRKKRPGLRDAGRALLYADGSADRDVVGGALRLGALGGEGRRTVTRAAGRRWGSDWPP